MVLKFTAILIRYCVLTHCFVFLYDLELLNNVRQREKQILRNKNKTALICTHYWSSELH